jgi:hypothetical protein
VSLADTLADQLGHIRIQREQLGIVEAHLLAAIDVAHDLEQGTISSTATRPGPPPSPGAAVAVDESPLAEVEIVDSGIGTYALPVQVLATPEPDPPSGKKASKYDLAQVAAVAREAIELGIYQSKHVHEKVPGCPSTAMASFLITSARQAGHDIPKRKSGRAAGSSPATASPASRSSAEAQVPGKRFECSTCDHSTEDVRAIMRHTRADHGRDAHVSERMPT